MRGDGSSVRRCTATFARCREFSKKSISCKVHIRTEVVAFAPNHRPELLTALRNELRHTLHQFRFILLSLAEGHSIHGCSLVLGHGYKLASAIHLLMERLSSSWICFLSTRQKQAQSLNENTALSHRSKTASNIRSLD